MTVLNTAPTLAAPPPLSVRTHTGADLMGRMKALADYIQRGQRVALSRHPGWLTVLEEGLGHTPYALEAVRGERTVGVLCLAYVKHVIFGRFLVGLPYLNTGGVVADDAHAAEALINRAVELADQLGVRYLELRHEWALDHPAFNDRRGDKVHMRLDLPVGGKDVLFKQFPAKLRSQIRSGERNGFTIHWGGEDLLDEFHGVFSRNMRDLGSPTYGRELFAATVRRFPGAAEFCVLRDQGKAISVALLLHGQGVTEVPSASALREYNSKNANMAMYWKLLERACDRGQEVFDFGRSSEGSTTYRFKKQWGATPFPAEWQFYLRRGTVGDMRRDNPKYRLKIAIWKRLPLGLTRVLGPKIVRGIP
ncbi:MAG: FemAB family XrtA/PEP-CTERM system-associated protein [Gemmataceae bacterium]